MRHDGDLGAALKLGLQLMQAADRLREADKFAPGCAEWVGTMQIDGRKYDIRLAVHSP